MYVPVRDGQLWCEVSGTGDPLLLVHGYPLTGAMWAEVTPRLSKSWRCIVPDLRGHGQSSVSDEMTMTRMANDLAELLDGLDEKRPVVLVGLSMGGIIAQDFYQQHRKRVRALVLCDTRYQSETPEGVTRRIKLAEAALTQGSSAVVDTMIGPIFGEQIDPAVRQQWYEIMCRTSSIGVAAASRGLAHRPDYSALLPTITVPTLLIYGEQDAITPISIAREMEQKIPGARLAIIPRCGHVPPLERPDEFTTLLETFIISI
ncbi:MAG: AB hydrolase superfamily protein YdjP [Phycisphaerae bacterium]|nr:AB hydrolase superfamily protein YdjP [Phycisphaerae bacterium]